MMNLPNLLAIQGGSLKPEHLLGLRVDTRIPDGKFVDYADAKVAWEREGLDMDVWPDKPKAVNIAEGACRSVEQRRGGGSSKAEQVQVDRVHKSADEVEYRVTRLLRDMKARDIEHAPAMNVNFNRAKYEAGGDPWEFIPHRAEHYIALQDLQKRIRETFTEREHAMPGATFRRPLREYLTRKDKLGAVNLSRNTSSSYFVGIEHAGTLDALERVVMALFGADADMDMIPMADSKGVRELVAKHTEFTVKEEATDLLNEVIERASDAKAPRKDWLANMLDRAQALKDHDEKMRQRLGKEQFEANVAIDLIQKRLAAMVTGGSPVTA